MNLVNGKEIASLMKKEMKKKIKENGLNKKLAIFYVGESLVIDSFIKTKKKFGKDIGVVVQVFKYKSDASEEFLINEIKQKSKDYDGVVVQLPLPDNLNRKKILNSIPKKKDVDLLSSLSYKDFLDKKSKITPPVAFAIDKIFSYYGVELKNKKIVIIGNGALVGRPTNDLLLIKGLKPKIITEKTKNKEYFYKNADIIISGVGFPNLIKKSFVKKGVILIDAGSSSEIGQIKGDISADCKSVASLFSTVPGGVGPITVASLFYNLLYNN